VNRSIRIDQAAPLCADVRPLPQCVH
jgi:hypothetical protein